MSDNFKFKIGGKEYEWDWSFVTTRQAIRKEARRKWLALDCGEVERDGDPYVYYPGPSPSEITLDGNFTIQHLRQIVAALERLEAFERLMTP